jgi:ubiquinone/menaquinone biosynthesis C-methylase UbiE
MAPQETLTLVGNHDESARDAFVLNLKWHINLDLSPGLKTVFDGKATKAFKAKNGRAPETRHEMRRQMEQEPYFQMWGSLWSTAQTLMWQSGETKFDRMAPDLESRAKVKGPKKGSLRTDPNMEVPRYVTAVDIHGQPGGYGLDLDDNDISAGAMYEQGMLLYGKGQGQRGSGTPPSAVIRYLNENHPEFAPTSILDIGCSVGGSIPDYAKAYPNAVFHAIDVSAGMLRYGHPRMEAEGIVVHFSQQNAEHTDFKDNSFDLIVSNITLHEVSHKAFPHIMKESHRILKPGGIMAHLEVPLRNAKMDLYNSWYRDWSTHYNNEPFWGKLHDMDVIEPITNAGFKKDQTFDQFVPTSNDDGTWWIFGGQK